MNKDTETASPLLNGYIRQITGRLAKTTPEQWDWRIAVPAGTIHDLANHILGWLIADRMHIMEPDARFHDPMPPLPQTPTEMAQALDQERIEWTNMLRNIRIEDMDAPRQQFNHPQAEDQDVRWMVMHTLQTTIYDFAQMMVIYAALGFEGNQPYSDKPPAEFYRQMRAGWQAAAKEQ